MRSCSSSSTAKLALSWPCSASASVWMSARCLRSATTWSALARSCGTMAEIRMALRAEPSASEGSTISGGGGLSEMRSSAASILETEASAPSSRACTSCSARRARQPVLHRVDLDLGELHPLAGGNQRGVLLGAVAVHIGDLLCSASALSLLTAIDASSASSAAWFGRRRSGVSAGCRAGAAPPAGAGFASGTGSASGTGWRALLPGRRPPIARGHGRQRPG